MDAWHRTPALEALWRPLGAYYGNKAQPGLGQRLISYFLSYLPHSLHFGKVKKVPALVEFKLWWYLRFHF